jgi:putative transposase
VPWKETCVMEQRVEFITKWRQERETMAELCRSFGISRETGYKWVRRYDRDGFEGLTDRSRAPHHCPHVISESIEDVIVQARTMHPHWGPKKLVALLQREVPKVLWPAASTVGEILHRRGLVVPRRRSRRCPVYTQPFAGCEAPNTVWSADMKGWFVTRDGSRCDPFTLTDNYSRYLLRCQLVSRTDHEHIQPVIEAAFRQYGLPQAMRTDNGVPFATTTVGGLSRLSIWLYHLGVTPERIAPGRSAQNGRHERMHRTLKAETANPPQRTRRAQQQAFDRFRQEYNQHRPHEAVGQKTPASLYHGSARPYPSRLPELSYPDHYVLRKVRGQGEFKWRSHQLYLSGTLAGETVGFDKIDDHRWIIYFGPVRLAQLDSRHYRIIHYPKTRPK